MNLSDDETERAAQIRRIYGRKSVSRLVEAWSLRLLERLWLCSRPKILQAYRTDFYNTVVAFIDESIPIRPLTVANTVLEYYAFFHPENCTPERMEIVHRRAYETITAYQQTRNEDSTVDLKLISPFRNAFARQYAKCRQCRYYVNYNRGIEIFPSILRPKLARKTVRQVFCIKCLSIETARSIRRNAKDQSAVGREAWHNHNYPAIRASRDAGKRAYVDGDSEAGCSRDNPNRSRLLQNLKTSDPDLYTHLTEHLRPITDQDGKLVDRETLHRAIVQALNVTGLPARERRPGDTRSKEAEARGVFLFLFYRLGFHPVRRIAEWYCVHYTWTHTQVLRNTQRYIEDIEFRNTIDEVISQIRNSIPRRAGVGRRDICSAGYHREIPGSGVEPRPGAALPIAKQASAK